MDVKAVTYNNEHLYSVVDHKSFFSRNMMYLSLSLRRIEECQTADEFYSTMGCLTQDMLEDNLIDSNELMQVRVPQRPVLHYTYM